MGLFTLPSKRLWRNWDRQLLRSALPIVVLELACNFFSQVSVVKIGSGMFQVAYSFVVVLTAILGSWLLKKRLGCGRWISLFCISGAVMVSSTAQLQLTGVDAWDQLMGLICALIATVVVSGVYVMANHLLETPWDREVAKPFVLAQMIGALEVSILSVYFGVYVFPNWPRLVVDEMESDVTGLYSFSVYMIFVFVCGLHQMAFYFSCAQGPTGAVTTAVSKCIQTVGMFFASHLFFCDAAASQCLSVEKIVGTLGVCFGVVTYAYFSLQQDSPSSERKELSESDPRYPSSRFDPFDMVIGCNGDESIGDMIDSDNDKLV